MPVFCKGKGSICNTPCSNEACEYYDGTGANVIPSVADRIRSMSDSQLAAAIHDLYLRLCDHEFDLSEMWCRPEIHGLCTGSQEDRILFCDSQERFNCILCYLNSPADQINSGMQYEEKRDSGLVEDE